jgi:16S rRNA C967 or C1407 C5-methylase (RsmB/RsmF family)
VVDDFLAARRDFAAVPPVSPPAGRAAGAGRLLNPAGHDGDGFFVATLRRLP